MRQQTAKVASFRKGEFSNLREVWGNDSKAQPVAICLSDLHFRSTPPAFRSKESSWFDAMWRTVEQVKYVLDQIQKTYERKLLIIIAGDIFDKWNTSPAVINFAIDAFDLWRRRIDDTYHTILAIPGQHDLCYHSDHLERDSAFHTLVRSKRIYNIDHNTHHFRGIQYEGYGWNANVDVEIESNYPRVAVVHRYVWTPGSGNSYMGAPQTGRSKELFRQLNGPDLIISGDNHIPFYDKKHKTFNCGSLYRTTTDQIKYNPRIGIISQDLSVVSYELDCTADVYTDIIGMQSAEDSELSEQVQDFIKEIGEMGRGGLDFMDAVRRFAVKKKINSQTVKIINSLLEN